MKRREFIALLGSAAAAWPLAARAQQPGGMRRVGVLIANYSQTDREGQASIAAFLDTFQRLGWTDGRNVRIEYRWGAGDAERTKAAAAELVRSAPDAIVVASAPSLAELHRLTSTIPIVFTQVGEPVESGFVASLARPGGNITGVTNLTAQVGPKRLELMHALVPTAITVALLVNPSSPELAEPQAQELQVAARSLGLQLHVLNASTEREIDMAFATLVQLRPGGLVIVPDPFFTNRSDRLAALALRHAIPTIFQYPEFTAAGGLMSYGSNLRDLLRWSGLYTGRILKGEKPADLPVQQATKVELIVNLKTAKALGITMPTSILVRADEVIE